MKIAYFDCFSGVSGNMIIGALLDAGLDKNYLIKEFKKLPLKGYKITIKKVKKSGIASTYFNIKTTSHQPNRNLKEIKNLILNSQLEKDIQKKIIKIFEILAEAESKVHHLPIDKIHFHEIGAVDTILDITGAVIGIKQLEIEKIYCSPLNLGTGFIKSKHGILPVPAPATSQLIKELPVYGYLEKAELTTPTGVAIVKTISSGFKPMPEMIIKKIGLGAGTKKLKFLPNILRIFIGETQDKEKEAVLMVEFNLDDTSCQIFETFFEKALKNGALDVFLTPIQMKKNRPAFKVSLLIEEKNLEKISKLIFEETPTFGFRYYPVERIKLNRQFKKISTPFGKITFKIGYYKNKIISISPEYEELKKICLKKKLPIRKVMEIAQIEASKQLC